MVETALATREMLAISGAKVLAGCGVLGIEHHAGRVSGVRVQQGHIEGRQVIVAAGIASAGLLAQFGVTLPMLARPGLLLHTRPVARLARHILASPAQRRCVRTLPGGWWRWRGKR